VGWWDSEKVGWWEGEKMGRLEDEKMGNERIYLGSRTRRRPIGRDYAAAKDGEGRKQACRSRFRVSGRMLRLLQAPSYETGTIPRDRCWAGERARRV
jgi:hypothetical protein